MIGSKKITALLIALLFVLLDCSIFLFPLYAVEKNLPRFPKAELAFHKPFWSFLFNSIWPKPQFTFIIKNVGLKDDKEIKEGVIVLEIAEDKGLGEEPPKEDFVFFAYKIFGEIKPQKQIEAVFSFSEQYKPGRFRIKPTLFIFPESKSPIKTSIKIMKEQGVDVFKAWEHIYFQDWYKNLSQELGTLIITNGSYILEFQDKSFFFTYSGISLLLLLGGSLRLIVKRCKKKEPLDVYFKRASKRIYSLGEIYNSGCEDIIDLEVTIKYVDKSGKDQVKKALFIDENEDPLWAHPKTCNILRQGERKFIPDFPRLESEIIISGKGAKSGDPLNKILEFEIV